MPDAACRDAFRVGLFHDGKEETLNREEKKQAVAGLKEKLAEVKGMVITDYRGMTVAEMSELRRQLRRSGVEYRVVKNTLARIALKDTPFVPAADSLKGPVGLALGYDDPILAAKEIIEFAKKNQKLRVTGGFIENSFYLADELRAVSELPPRNVLLGMIAGVMQAPAARTASLLQATISRMAHAVSALKEKKAKAEAA